MYIYMHGQVGRSRRYIVRGLPHFQTPPLPMIVGYII